MLYLTLSEQCFFFFLLKSAIKAAKVCSLLTNRLKVLKSVMKTAKVWQFSYMTTKLSSCGSLYPWKTAKVSSFDDTFQKFFHSDNNTQVIVELFSIQGLQK